MILDQLDETEMAERAGEPRAGVLGVYETLNGAVVVRSHRHHAAKLCVLIDGGASELRGLTIETPERFDVMPRPALEPHENQYHAGGAHWLLVELDPDDARVRRALAGRAADPTLSRALAPLGRGLVRAFAGRGADRARQVRDAVRRILDTLDARRLRPAPAWLDAARERLLERLPDPPSLAELAGRVGVHPVHLAHSFRAHLGLTTRHYVRAHRVFRAMDLIDRGWSLATIAAAVGFADQSHMTRSVRAARAAPPAALRRRMRERTP